MGLANNIKLFFSPTQGKLLLTGMFIVLSVLLTVLFPWGGAPIYSIPLVLVFYPLLVALNLGIFGLIIAIPILYVYSCILYWIFHRIKDKKPLVALAVVFLFLFIGLDEPLVNATVNQPSYACNTNADCAVKTIGPSGPCGPAMGCTNSTWNYYRPLVNSAFALSCARPLLGCTCEINKCVSENLYRSTDLSKCEQLKENDKQECIRVVTRNIERGS